MVLVVETVTVVVAQPALTTPEGPFAFRCEGPAKLPRPAPGAKR